MRSILLASLLNLLITPQPTSAQSVPGNGLYEACTSEDPALLGFCLGYLVGHIEGQFWGGLLFAQGVGATMETSEFNAFANSVFHHCVPSDASNQQLRDVVVKYLSENPASRHEPARYLVWEAYREAFPCE
ncbi:Rap1a/Tai family immunity protein [Marimonas lutisalis]|uniref:Rap1a/Tai family immunity protein n=1 Tax=Marimonas lutisalis TaxID=2545756 RepID=UPI001375B856